MEASSTGLGSAGGASASGGDGSSAGGSTRTASEAGLLSPQAGRARKAAKAVPQWTDFVEKDTAASTGSNTYYFCKLSGDCPFAHGAPFAPPRVRSSFSGGRKVWVDHVLKCLSANQLAELGVEKVSGTACAFVRYA